jgi:hypothetical protein
MMLSMKHRLMTFWIGLFAWLAAPMAALADDEAQYDARVEGFSKSVVVEDRSGTLTWLMLALLCIICLSVLFKNARRTHLD